MTLLLGKAHDQMARQTVMRCLTEFCVTLQTRE
jgi:hypothetical protein